MKKVLTHGVFDVIHFGHLMYFKEAKSFGDHLTVSVTADRYVNKGPGRPYFSLPQRVAMLKSINIIDDVIVSDHPTAIEIINLVKPDVYVKGPDYKDLSKDVTGQIYNEKLAVESHGGKLVFTEDITFSSSTIINKFLNSWTDEQKKTIELVKESGGINAIERAMEQIEKLSVTVVGEPIYDVYRFVTPEGISSKSPTVSARFLYEEEYQGGSLAIARGVKYFANNTRLHLPDKSIRKIRYLSDNTRIFECTDIPQDFWGNISQEKYLDTLKALCKSSDLVIVADFGHGMFNDSFIQFLDDQIDSFIALNVQTNSSNYGYNLFYRHKAYDYLCIDTREARLALGDRTSPAIEIAQVIKDTRPFESDLSITLGPNGASLFMGSARYDSPAFSDGVIDAIGAGDAYFLITSLLLNTDCPREIIPFVGNVYAGLKCKIIGNKESVSKANLLKACSAILK